MSAVHSSSAFRPEKLMFQMQVPADESAVARLFERGEAAIPGGVCSSTRRNKAWDSPVYAQRAAGSRFWDVAGREFLDFSMSHGATLLGHAPECLRHVFDTAWEHGVLCSMDTPFHVDLAEQLCRVVPCAERVRFTGSGSEATLHALRLCRAASGRDKIIRFFGHFHGYHEFTYIGGHPPADQLDAQPPYRESAGIPESMAELIIPVEYNNLEALEAVVAAHAGEAGTLLVEPVDYNCGCITPAPGFLEATRALADEHDLVLFFDEVQSFAKASPGGAQQDFGVTPDICTIGKSLGGGLPLSAIGGRADLMDLYAPTGPVAHSGTFNAPLPSILGGLAFVDHIQRPGFWKTIGGLGEVLFAGLEDIAGRSRLPVVFQHHGSRFGIIFGTRDPVTNYSQALVHDPETMLEFCRQTTSRGVYFHDYGGGPCHHGYSLAHSLEDIDQALQAIDDSLQAMG
ncbi:MAG: glutamate-1-semialdehyde 2,1-aminomutase [Planctomycetaceae bacterium]|nr:MAG: glutamate-1-semialdehyde 2,1-aminomutase [Planctomycetaceae bacterium]|tara:strand:- start:97 stop:1467 length:1371 start_codon:yes stop_codon:yes gene_type:complete